MTNRTSYATRIRRSGSTKIEPDRFRVVSPLRRTDRQDERSHHRRRSNNVNFAPYTEAETASSKFQWDNLLDAKQLENESSSSRSFASRFSGSGPLGLTGPPRSYSGFVSPLKESEAVHLPPMHCEHQHLGYGFSVSRTPPSQFGEKSGLFRNVGIGTDCNFEHMHVQIPKPNSVEVSNNNKNRVLNYSEVQKSEKSDGGFMSSEFQRSSIMDSIVEKIDGALGNIDSLRKRTPWEEEKEDEQHLVAPSKCIDFIQPSNYCVEPLCCSRHVVPEYRDNEESWSLRGYEKSAYTYSDYQGNCKVLPVLDDDEIKETEVEMFDSSYGGKTFENQIWNDFNAASSHPHRRCMHGPSMDADANASFGDGIVRVKFDDRPQKSRYSPVPAERTSAKNEMATRISVKKRLRYFGGRIIHLPSSQGFCSKNVHARLGPRVVLAEEPCDAVQHAKMKKIKRIFCEISRSAPCSDPSSESEVKEKAKHSKRSKTEPPEDSKEFKQLVQNAFFKFVKLLNENPSQRRKYIDREGIDTLRCTLCGRSVSSSA
ncbi:hypothetical protein PIB30_016027 [Stylosanthes scabra]|uniref:Uncharacterized protein n=1 Tax=Stylosanthes scabra TaxID=79078 RepID=A0ABU6Y454_9FABA|nr:hypothetical protein [Stylosanthes scabra]